MYYMDRSSIGRYHTGLKSGEKKCNLGKPEAKANVNIFFKFCQQRGQLQSKENVQKTLMLVFEPGQ